MKKEVDKFAEMGRGCITAVLGCFPIELCLILTATVVSAAEAVFACGICFWHWMKIVLLGSAEESGERVTTYMDIDQKQTNAREVLNPCENLDIPLQFDDPDIEEERTNFPEVFLPTLDVIFPAESPCLLPYVGGEVFRRSIDLKNSRYEHSQGNDRFDRFGSFVISEVDHEPRSIEESLRTDILNLNNAANAAMTA
ncbi:hypothetical protein AAMO2058_000354400 [Amorphochlora amoebiformis]